MNADKHLIGIPDDAPRSVRPVASEENLFSGDDENQAALLDEALEESTSALKWLHAGKPGKWLTALAVLATCMVLLVMFGQILSLTTRLAELPPIVRFTGFGLLALLVGGALWALLRLVSVFRRLRTTPRLPVETLRQLARRAELRSQANLRLQAARETLHDFLCEYPLQADSPSQKLLGRYLDAQPLADFKAAVLELRKSDYGTAEGWLEGFDRRFLGTLDNASRRCIRRYARRVALKTAALPTGFDTAVILLNAYLLASDICVLYNLRTNRSGTLAVMLRVLFNAFAAGQMQDLSESAVDLFFESGGAVAGMGRAVASRAAEGSVNYLLFLRLGASMVRHLRPIWPPGKI